jgi:hypothetical protein
MSIHPEPCCKAQLPGNHTEGCCKAHPNVRVDEVGTSMTNSSGIGRKWWGATLKGIGIAGGVGYRHLKTRL